MVNKNKKYCKNCKRKTNHIKRGFGTPGGLSGNARIECSECDGEIKPKHL